MHCWWECELIQPLQRTVWRFLKSLKIELPELPCWSSGKESASEGSRRRFSPQSRKVPRAVGQPSLGSTATEAHAPTACARQQEEPPQEEASWHPEKGHRQQWKYSTAENKQTENSEKTEPPCGPEIPLLGYTQRKPHFKKVCVPEVRGRTIYNSQDMEAT